jgi:hypothetical protein
VEFSEDGDLSVGGIPWERINEGERYDLAIRLAELRAGKIGLICIDGCEKLSIEHQKMIVERLLESGHQAILTEVAVGGLQIQNIDTMEDFKRSKSETVKQTQAFLENM